LNVRRFIALVLLCGASRLSAQVDTLRAFRAPASPAFVLIDAAPTAIARPSTPQRLVMSLVSALQDEDFPPKRYALEIAPYWLTRHRTLTFEQYAAPAFWQSIIQTLSISVATTNIPEPDTGTVLAFGVRTAYVSSRDLSWLRPLRDTILQIQRKILETDDQAIEDSLRAEMRPVNLRLQRALRTERTGWTIEGAAAGAMDFQGDIASNGKVSRVGLWVTTGYRLSKPNADLLAVVRLTRDDRVAPRQDFLDLGGRLVLDKEDLTLSGEYVYRSITSAGSSRPSYRLTAAVEYRVSTDILLTAALGRGADERGPDTGPLSAQIGVDFGLGAIPLIRTGGGR